MSMTHRERVLAALNHEETDRVPMDFGSTLATSITVPAYEDFKKFLGIDHETKIGWKRQRVVIPDESILKKFDIDTRALLLGKYRGEGDREIDEDTIVDIWGTAWKREPSGHFINIDGPFVNRDPDIELLDTHDWLDPDDPGFYQNLKENAEFLRRKTDCAIVLNLPVGIFTECQFLRGYVEWLIDLYENQEFASRMMHIIAGIWIKIAENALDEIGDNVDVIFWGDDLAIQESTFISPQVYRELVKPQHKRMIEAIKSRSEAKIHFHSCGSIYPLIEDLIEIGVDVLNPIQVNARNMEPERLKKEFGSRLSFWGAVDTQHLLPFGTPEEVRTDVRKIIDCLGKGGGYVLSSVQNIQADVPPENIIAMFEEGKSYY
jgi:uroporphyrinogen decarboxylase